MISVIPSLPIVFTVFVALLHIRETATISESDRCPDGYIIFRSEKFTQKCVKVSTEPKTWAEADKICKSDLGYLINMNSPSSFSFFNYTAERIVYIANFTFETGITEFWTGMHVREGRLVWDGFPVENVSRSFYASQFETDWSWEAGQPSELRECGKMKQNLSSLTYFDELRNQSVTETRPLGKYMAALAPCEKRLPFACERFVTSTGGLKHTSSCPDGWIGNAELDACYRIFSNSLAFEDASHFCRQLNGYMMSTFSDFESAISRGVYNWFRNNDAYLRIGSLLVWVNSTGVCNALASETIDVHNCYSALPFACQMPTQYNAPGEITAYSPYEDQSELLNRRSFSPLPVIFKMDRPPSENEVVVVEHNGQEVIPSDYIVMSLGSSFQRPYIINLTIPAGFRDEIPPRGDTTFILVPDFKETTGYYSLRLYSINPQHVIQSNAILVRYAEPDVFIYVMTVRMPAQVANDFPSQNAVAFNLCRDSSYIGQLNEMLFFALSDIREQEIYQAPWLYSFTSYRAYIEYVQPSNLTVRLRLFVVFPNGRSLSSDFEQYIRSEMQTLMTHLEQSRLNQSTVRVRSTVACPTIEVFVTNSSTPIVIPFTRINLTGYSWNRCYPGLRAFAFAPCLGDYDTGAHWGDVTIATDCQQTPDLETSNQSLSLKNLSKTPVDMYNIIQVINDTTILTSVRDTLKDVDVIYTAQILENLQQISYLPSTVLDEVIKVTNNILDLDPAIIRSAQKVASAANRILRSMDDLTNNVNMLDQDFRRIIEPYVAAEVWEQTEPNIIGIELTKSNLKQIENGSLLTLNTAPDNLQRVDTAIYLDPKLLEDSTSRLAMHVYWDTKMFEDNTGRYETISRVVAARLSQNRKPIIDLMNNTVTAIFLTFKIDNPRRPTRNGWGRYLMDQMHEVLILPGGHVCCSNYDMFKQEHPNVVCGHWNYTGNENAGGWSTKGCILSVDAERHICTCNHLTNFAVLIDLQPDRSLSEADKLALGIITKIGLGLSIVGLGLTILTFLIFRHLRKGRGQQTLVCLCLAMLGSAILFLVGIDRTETYGGCITVSVLLHYFILASFMWMLIEGILQYLRFVKVLGTYIPHFMIKTSIPAWGTPLIPVIVLLAVDYNLYYGGKGYCWMQLYPLYWSFILPIGLILFANFIVFALVIINLCRRPKGMQTNQSEHKMAVMNFQAGLAVLVLLGLTWVFGFIAVEEARVAFMYVFAFLNAFQGFFVFLLFTAREKQVRKSWTRLCCRKRRDNSSASNSESRGRNVSPQSSQTTNVYSERPRHV